MNKVKKIIVIILSVMIILNFGITLYNIFGIKNMNDHEKIKNYISETQKIIDFINLNYKNGDFYIENEEIVFKTSEKYKSIKHIRNFYGEGHIKLEENKIIELSIQYEEYCISYNNKILVKKNKCTFKGTSDKAAEHIIKNAVTDELLNDTVETGLDESFPFSSRKYFVGSNPHNYLVYGNSCYRIIGISQNDTIKIIYENKVDQYNTCVDSAKENSGIIALMAWDNKKYSDWNNSNLNNKMKKWSEEGKIDLVNLTVETNTDNLEKADWYIGEIGINNKNVVENISEERKYITNDKSYMGLINVTDYQKAGRRNNDSVMKIDGENNYLYKSSYNWWTINPINKGVEKNSVWQVNLDGSVTPETVLFSKDYSYFGIRIVMYLKSNLYFSGNGSQYNPYKIIN